MNQSCWAHAVLTASVFENDRPKLTICRGSASIHHTESRCTRQRFHPLSLAHRRYRAPRPFAWHPLWARYENQYRRWSSEDLRILDDHINVFGRGVPNLMISLFKPISNARDNTSPPECSGAQIDRAGVRGNKCTGSPAGVRRGSENGISIWKVAAFWASKDHSFLDSSHAHPLRAHTPARGHCQARLAFSCNESANMALRYTLDELRRYIQGYVPYRSCNSPSVASLPCFGRLFMHDASSSTRESSCSLQPIETKSCYLQPLHREPEQPARCSQPLDDWRWSDISGITCTHEVDITVEDILSDSPVSKTTCEDSVISNVTDRSPKAFYAFPSPVDTSHIDSGARVDASDAAASKISIDTASAVAYKDNQTLNASHVSAPASLAIFADSIPACIKRKLEPPPILFWLRSRLATEGECTVPTVLTVGWWQAILMRVLPLNSNSTTVNYRLPPETLTSYSKSASCWREILNKNPSADQVNRVCDDYRLVYLRTTDVLNVRKLKSSLRRHWLYRSSGILAIFPFATNLWEILVARNYVDRFIECAEACDCVVEEFIHPKNPVGHPSDFSNSFESCVRARERLIARASIAQLASDDNELALYAAAIYRDLVKLYRCYDAYNTIVSILLAMNQPAYSPGWSCIIGFSQYPTKDAT